MTADYYGIPPERVIGSAVGLRYDDDSKDVRYGSESGFLDEGPEKPIRIWTRIGRPGAGQLQPGVRPRCGQSVDPVVPSESQLG